MSKQLEEMSGSEVSDFFATVGIVEQMKRADSAANGRFTAAKSLQPKSVAPVGPMKFVGTDADGFAVFRGASVL